MELVSQKKAVFITLAIIVLLGGGFYFLTKSDQIPYVADVIKDGDEYKSLPLPPAQDGEREFEIISISKGGIYHARDTESLKELDLFIPADAEFTITGLKSVRAGFIITAKKWMEFSNGLVITQLSVSD